MKQKPAFKWLAITLLLSISIFCYAMYANFSVPNTDNINASTGHDDDENDKPDKPKIIYNDFPRSASVIDGKLVQNIGGMGKETLRNVHSFKGNTYVILDTASNSYDIKSDFDSVAVCMLNSDLTILNLLVLTGNDNEKYGSSKITGNGILITTHSETATTLYLIGYDLIIKNVLQFEPSNGSYMYYTAEGTYTFLTGNEKLSIKLISHDFEIKTTDSIALKYPQIIDVFPNNSGFDIYINGKDYYGCINYSITQKFKNENLIHNSTIKQIFPKTEDGNLIFSALIYCNENYRLVKLDNKMNIKTHADIGTALTCFMFPLGNNYWIYQKGNNAKFMLYCSHLEKVIECPTDLMLENAVFYKNEKNNIKLFSFAKGNELKIISITNGVPKVEYSIKAMQSFVFVENNIIYFTSAAKDGFMSKNYGNSDIFIIKGGN